MLVKNRKLNLANAQVRQRLSSFSRVYSNNLLLKYGGGNPAAMVVVGKNVSKKAVERNKIKRHLYILIEDFFKRNNSFQLVIFVKKLISTREISEEFKKMTFSFNK